jgi:hydroxyquinol 1,2-dioxygenase
MEASEATTAVGSTTEHYAPQMDVDPVVEEVVASFADTPEERLAACLEALVRHLHAVARELRPTVSEWEAVVDFLTRTGQKCDDTRQEFVLLSDVLGISSLVETLSQGDTEGITEATVLGPFHMVTSPERRLGESIDELDKPNRCLVSGRVLSPDGTPLVGATVDVWQADESGLYDVQAPDLQPSGNGRGLFTTDAEGRFWFTTVVPAPYPIPTDGPVGALLTATNRHPYRPAHIHILVEATGYARLTTHVFVADSPYLDSDAVFAVRASLVRDFVEVDEPDTAASLGLPNPFRRANIDLVLEPQLSR